MSTYVLIATDTAQQSANITTDKIRISTEGPVLFAVGFPQVEGTGTITCDIGNFSVIGNGTVFTTELGLGWWIGDGNGNTVGIVNSIEDNGNLTLTTLAGSNISHDVFTINKYGVPFVDIVLHPSSCPTASGIIPSGGTFNSVIVGQGNVVSFIRAGDANATFSITELGMPHADTGTSGINLPPALGGPTGNPVPV